MEVVNASFKIPNSLFTSIRMAWNVRFAGCGPSRLAAAGIAWISDRAEWKALLAYRSGGNLSE